VLQPPFSSTSQLSALGVSVEKDKQADCIVALAHP
jgi:hypothetical protein